MQIHEAWEVNTRTHGTVETAFECLFSVEQLVGIDTSAGIPTADAGDDAGAAFAETVKGLLNRQGQTDGLKGKVHAETTSEVFDGLHGIAFGGVDKVTGPHGTSMGFFVCESIDGDDLVGTDHTGALDDV